MLGAFCFYIAVCTDSPPTLTDSLLEPKKLSSLQILSKLFIDIVK